MANWTGVITNAGNDVLSEWVNEKTLNFDSAAAGQGTVATAGMLAQTTLVNQKQIASIIGADRVSTGIRLKIRITAPQTAYTLNQYGVWASVTGGSSTMIALFQHEDGIPIPSATESPDFVYTFYALISTSNTGEWTVNIDTSALVTLDDVETAIATAVATKEGLIKNAAVKNSIADADSIAVVDSADSSKTKRVLWSTIKSALGQVFAPLTRKINNKSLSSDVVLTGDDIATSTTDGTTVSSSLSNTLGYRADIQPGDDMNDLLTIGVYRIQSGSYAAQISNLPPDYGPKAGVCAVIHTLQLLASYGDTSSTFSALWMRDNYMSGSERRWTEWVKVAGRTSPQEFDLPLLDGWYTNDRAQYRKTQEGLVVVNAILELSEGYSASDGTQIAVLPEGFRPVTSFMYPVSVQDGSTRASAIVQIGTNGTIIYYGASNTTAVFRIYWNAAFFAAS